MKPPVCDSAFDVAVWLNNRAYEDGEYLQPQKLHRLMYLAQAYYGAASRGQKLMPCVFVTSTFGPIEPALWRAFENGIIRVNSQTVPSTQAHFLDSLWRRFGAHSVDHLTRMTVMHQPYQTALKDGKRSEISFEAMVEYYGRKPNEREALDERIVAPSIDNVLRPRVMRSHKGKPVNVHRWVPTKVVSTKPPSEG